MIVRQLGQIDYREALELQESLRAEVQAGGDEVLLLLEHPPVYTLGRRSEPGDLPMGEEWCRAQGIDVVRTDRGGKLTYHGPGQLVGYPIMRVTDVIEYVRTMERAIIAALAGEGIAATTREGKDFTGVWVEDRTRSSPSAATSTRKIASIGVHVQRGVTTHGFAVNVDNDLAPFGWVVACGLPSVQMTSVAVETGAAGRLPGFRDRMANAFCAAFARVGSMA